MNKLSKISALLFLVSAPVLSSYGQTFPAAIPPKSGTRLTIGADLLSPTGRLGNTYDGGYGGFLQADVPVGTDKLLATFTTGVARLYAQENAEGQPISPDATLIPIKAGLKYLPEGKFYVQGEAGAIILANKPDFANANRFSLTYAPQVGYQIPVNGKNSLDVGIRYQGIIGNQSVLAIGNFVGIKAGYAFNLTK